MRFIRGTLALAAAALFNIKDSHGLMEQPTVEASLRAQLLEQQNMLAELRALMTDESAAAVALPRIAAKPMFEKFERDLEGEPHRRLADDGARLVLGPIFFQPGCSFFVVRFFFFLPF